MIQLTFKRYEIKYVLTDEQRKRLAAVMERYMVPDEWGASTVHNVYYDTPTRLLVRRSSEHPEYKEKVRIRCYGTWHEGDDVFVELKKKFDGVVYKRRCTMDQHRMQSLLLGQGNPQTQIEREIDYTCRSYGGLEPAFYIGYDREAFYARDDHEFRMTFDRKVRGRTTGLSLNATGVTEQYLEDGLSLLEVKAGGAIPLWLTEFLCKEGLYKTSFSKVGIAWQRELAKSLNGRTTTARPHLGSAARRPQFVPQAPTIAFA
ncbi:MAG: polyphosphate polymerase domain-containing protein [Coriobacteriales bacterium]|nr:polyphosphate polymerase domain-containing protein [Coriobacteriales bacterium]